MPARSTETILIVDDERGPRDSLRMILAPAYQVRTASNAHEALELLRRERIDVVTLDLVMPGMSGLDLMRRMHDEFPNTEIIVVTGCGSTESAAESVRFGICDYLQKPFDVVQVGAAITRAVERRRARNHLQDFLTELGRVVGHDREASSILEEVRQSRKLRHQLGGLFGAGLAGEADGDDPRTFDFLQVLAETIESKDRFMRGHARRVAFYAGLLGDRLGVGGVEQEQLHIAAFLHDLGKVGVPTDLLLREGALDPAERQLVEQHPEIGARLVRPLVGQSDLTLAIRHHHEWWDGTGYPDGLAGEQIPFAARIVSVVDAFDAMSCDRPYRQALRREVVLGELRRFAGVQFDPDIAKAFVSLLESSADDVDITVLAESMAGPSDAP
jgi:response regulator RpfG family c-di-GMP phosphodiesterase